MNAPAEFLDLPTTPNSRERRTVIAALGVTQILAWGSSYYLLAVLAKPIAVDTGWSLAWIVGGLSLGLLVQGMISPQIGDAIERHGGRPILAASAVLLAVGLLGLALTPSLVVYVGAWLVIGVGMGAGLYEAAFSTLGRLYGAQARGAITGLTLFGGFASTVCWPLSGFLTSAVGWRGACLIYAALHVAIALPIYWLALPREGRRDEGRAASATTRPTDSARVGRSGRTLFLLVAVVFTLGSFIASVVSVHLLNLLQARDIGLAAAVALGALVGPAQVGARVVEMIFGKHQHPIWTTMASAVLTTFGVGLLWSGFPLASLALVLYGAGVGVKSIARGTLPLAVFGSRGYASMMGRIAMPSLIVSAAAPSVGAMLIDNLGANMTLAVITATALANVCLVAVLWIALSRGNR